MRVQLVSAFPSAGKQAVDKDAWFWGVPAQPLGLCQGKAAVAAMRNALWLCRLLRAGAWGAFPVLVGELWKHQVVAGAP